MEKKGGQTEGVFTIEEKDYSSSKKKDRRKKGCGQRKENEKNSE